MAKPAIEDNVLLKAINQGMSAAKICDKFKIDMNTLKRRHHHLMVTHQKYYHLILDGMAMVIHQQETSS